MTNLSLAQNHRRMAWAVPLSDDTALAKTARGNWARFIKKVFAFTRRWGAGIVCLLAAEFFLSRLFLCPLARFPVTTP